MDASPAKRRKTPAAAGAPARRVTRGAARRVATASRECLPTTSAPLPYLMFRDYSSHTRFVSKYLMNVL